MQLDTRVDDRLLRATGRGLIGAAVVLLVFNVLFPRAADPWDVPSVLTMMADNALLRQVSFLALTIALWVVTAGLVTIARSLSSSRAVTLAWLGVAASIMGAALFAVAAGLGMAATGAAVQWTEAGADIASTEFAVAGALNRADDAVWFLSIVAYWGGLGLLGTAMAKSTTFPRWMGVWIGVLGFAGTVFVGVPLAVGIERVVLLFVFGAVATLTALWALVTGIWLVRRLRS